VVLEYSAVDTVLAAGYPLDSEPVNKYSLRIFNATNTTTMITIP
jgi:hypothetical protein